MEDSSLLGMGSIDEIQQITEELEELRLKQNQDFAALGQAYYELYQDEDGAPALQERISAVKRTCEQIEHYEEMISRAKGVEWCQNCHAELIAGADFCIHCGAKVVRSETDDMTPICPECGTVVGSDDLFCMCCGAKLYSEANEIEEV